MRRLVIVAACIAWTVVALQSYAVNPQQWPAGTTVVPYSINPTSRTLAPDAVIAAVLRMADVWNAVSNAKLQYVGTTTKTGFVPDGQNVVFFIPQDGGGLSADTYRWWDGAGVVYDTDIGLYEGTYQFYLDSGCQTPGLYLENTIVHEFGHLLGLAHTDVPSATMYYITYQCDRSLMTLEPDDISGIQALYPVAPPPPPPDACVTTPLVVTVLSWPTNNGGKNLRYESSQPIAERTFVSVRNRITSITFTDTRGCTATVSR